jgi:hypothetical protein
MALHCFGVLPVSQTGTCRFLSINLQSSISQPSMVRVLDVLLPRNVCFACLSLRAPALILRRCAKETYFCILELRVKLWQLWPVIQWCCVPVCEHGSGDGEGMIGEAESAQVLVLLSRLGDYLTMILPGRASQL